MSPFLAANNMMSKETESATTATAHQSLLNTGSCILCASSAKLVCQRCGDFYCSNKCQQSDWQRHRFICFPMPALVHPMACSVLSAIMLTPPADHIMQKIENVGIAACDINDVVDASVSKTPAHQIKKSNATTVVNELGSNERNLVENKTNSNAAPAPAQHLSWNSVAGSVNGDDNDGSISSQNSSTSYNKSKQIKSRVRFPALVAMPPSNSVVYISGFRTPNRCCLRDGSESANKAYFDICERVNMLAEEQPKLSKPHVSGYALAEYKGLYQRIKVLSIRADHSSRVLFVDYGIITTCNVDEMREISEELLQLPCYCLPVQLKNVPNYVVNEEIEMFLTLFESEKFYALYGNRIDVELVHTQTGKSLNAQIRDFCANMEVFDSKPKAKKNGPQRSNMEINTKTEPQLVEQPKPSAAAEQQPAAKSEQTKSLIFEQQNSPKEIQQPAPKAESSQAMEHSKAESAKPAQQLAPKAESPKLSTPKATSPMPAASNATLAQPEQQSVTQTRPKTPPKAMPPMSVQKQSSKPMPPPPKEEQLSKSKATAKPEQVAERMLVPPFEICRLSDNSKEGLDVNIVDNTSLERGIFGAFDRNYASEYASVHSYLMEFKDSEPYVPVCKEYVIAKFQDDWYRAKVMEIKNQPQISYSVLYIDFSNVDNVTGEDIRRYPADLKLPCHTSICLIEGFPHRPNAAQLSFLKETLTMNSLLHIDSVSYLHDMALVNCKTLIDQLHKM